MNLLLANFDCLDSSWICRESAGIVQRGGQSVLFPGMLNPDFSGSFEGTEIVVEAIPPCIERPNVRSEDRLRAFLNVLKEIGLSKLGQYCAETISRCSPDVLALPELFSYWRNSYPSAFLKCLKKHSPDFVLLGLGNMDAAICSVLCREQGIPFAYLLSPYFEFKEVEPIILADPFAKALVSSRCGYHRLVRQGISGARVVFYRSTECESLPVVREISCSPEKEILLALQNRSSDALLLGLGIEFLLEHPEVCLRVRPHPSTRESDLLALKLKVEKSGVRQRIRFSQGISLEEDLRRAHVVCSFSSNVVLSATKWHRPVVLWENSFLPPEVSFARKGHAFSVTTASEMFSVFREILFNIDFFNVWKEQHREDYLEYFSPDAPSLMDQVMHLQSQECSGRERENHKFGGRS